MSDLISRSELIKHFEAVQSQECAIGLDFVAIIDEIKEQPTAYSVEQVVERLNRETISSSIKESLGLLKAIEIVKQCGVSDDVCEWKKSEDYPFDWIVGCDGCEVNHKQGDYCPRCGKKIKVVE